MHYIIIPVVKKIKLTLAQKLRRIVINNIIMVVELYATYVYTSDHLDIQ